MKIDLVITAITPGIALGLALYFVDRHDREPLKMLMKVFFMGVFIVIPTILVENILSSFNVFYGLAGVFYRAFIVAGLTEEFMKRKVVLKTVYYNPVFNEKLDGIIYCAFSALGFATIENIMYVVFRFSDVEFVGLYRAIVSVPAHMLFAVTMGYYLSLAKFASTTEMSKYYYKRSLVVPTILHGIFDFILMSEIQILMILFVPFVIYLWIVNLRKLNIYYKDSKDNNDFN
ncbi:RsiW-degrading membrane proteinase PrsW (M82 family) [Sedimentibacter acidaminivorans]|uniref:Protease PrsW n=1 Tax=Sedimentibacter acidaminivorans TaxID=913099 RepID=A0ABS4GDZ6_9FIRM|nr:PrsW family glutamic-type intramembrane protease [Sedimentibacter acidaminivorans]MBP1925919.1 RsiW-degrading membrane proteinase PrsW (M82 family) [Sedimentibacter acidaminivorans]